MQFVDGVRPARRISPEVLHFEPKHQTLAQPAPLPVVRRRAMMDDIRPMSALITATAEAMPAPPIEAPATTQTPWRWIVAGGVTILLVGLGTIGVRNAIADRTSTETTQAKAAPAPPPAPAAQAAAPPVDSTALASLLAGYSQTVGAPAGIVVKDLKTGANAVSNPDQIFTSASLYKLFVAQAIYKQVDNGQRRLGDRLAGTTVGDCLRLMIAISDNNCGEALGGLLSWDSYNPTLKTLGFNHTKFGDPMQTSASDVALLLERLYGGTLLSPNSSNQFLGLLKAQQINNRLPQGLPAGTVIAHKTGDLDGLVHDAGIVYGPKTDFLVVMASGPWPNVNAAPDKFSDLASRLWTQLEQ